MPRRPSRIPEIRREIVKRARKLLLGGGLRTVSVEAVRKGEEGEPEFASGSVYNAFPGRMPELLLALYADLIADIDCVVGTSIEEREKTFEGTVAAIARDLVTYARAHQDEVRALLTLMQQAAWFGEPDQIVEAERGLHDRLSTTPWMRRPGHEVGLTPQDVRLLVSMPMMVALLVPEERAETIAADIAAHLFAAAPQLDRGTRPPKPVSKKIKALVTGPDLFSPTQHSTEQEVLRRMKD